MTGLVSDFLTPKLQVAALSQAAEHRARSQEKARQASLATDAGQILETWANLSSWSSGSAVQVSGGKVYSAGNGAGSGINRSFALADGETARITQVVDVAAGATSGGVIVGVSKDTAGGAATSGGTNGLGISFTSAGVSDWNQGVSTLLNATTAAGKWIVSTYIDELYISRVARKSDGSMELFCPVVARSGFAVNNLWEFASDSRQLTGNSIGKTLARKGFTTASYLARPGVEDVAPSVQWVSLPNGDRARIMLPTNYDSRFASPLVIAFHSFGSDASLFSANANARLVANEVCAAGCIVASASLASSTTTFGAQASIDSYVALYEYVREHYSIGNVAFLAVSMGSIESLLTLAEGRIPGVRAWAAWAPTYDLAAAYATVDFTAAINTAYGITGSSPNTYAQKTAGHDPALMAPSAFKGVPMRAWAAADDTLVPTVANGQKLIDAVSIVSPDARLITAASGGHSFSMTPYAADLAAFIKKYV